MAGTRSVIKFYEDKQFLCAVYQTHDGYITNGHLDGVGNQLKNFIKSKPFVCGIIHNSNYKEVFNGARCFVAQFIAEFKKEAGGLEISTENDEQEFTYKVVMELNEIIPFVETIYLTLEKGYGKGIGVYNEIIKVD